MEVKQTKNGKVFTGKMESSKSKFRKEHIELNINLKFFRKLLNRNKKVL